MADPHFQILRNDFDGTECTVRHEHQGQSMGHHQCVIVGDPSPCALIFARINGTGPTTCEVGCCHCGEIVLPEATGIRDMRITCEGNVQHWWSKQFELEVHRCAADPLAEHVTVAVATDLLLAGV